MTEIQTFDKTGRANASTFLPVSFLVIWIIDGNLSSSAED